MYNLCYCFSWKPVKSHCTSVSIGFNTHAFITCMLSNILTRFPMNVSWYMADFIVFLLLICSFSVHYSSCILFYCQIDFLGFQNISNKFHNPKRYIWLNITLRNISKTVKQYVIKLVAQINNNRITPNVEHLILRIHHKESIHTVRMIIVLEYISEISFLFRFLKVRSWHWTFGIFNFVMVVTCSSSNRTYNLFILPKISYFVDILVPEQFLSCMMNPSKCQHISELDHL